MAWLLPAGDVPEMSVGADDCFHFMLCSFFGAPEEKRDDCDAKKQPKRPDDFRGAEGVYAIAPRSPEPSDIDDRNDCKNPC
jgi:hypothetical protein